MGAQPDTSKFFVDQGEPSDLGAYCQSWDATRNEGSVTSNNESCAKGGTHYGADWCTEPWCYVAADNTCDPPASDTINFADTEFASLKFSTGAACSIDTCGQCLPIMEGDSAIIGVRLFHITTPAKEYMATTDAIFSPFYATQPGFISYTGALTQDPNIVLFISIYDTEENSAAAYDKGVAVHEQEMHGDPNDEKIFNYYGTITFTGDDITSGTPDCVKSFDVGDYLSSRMFYDGGKDRPQVDVDVSDNYKAWTDVESFDSYTASLGDEEGFYFETFNNENDSLDANVLALSRTNLDPTASLIFTTMGEVAFDSSCSSDYPDLSDDGDGSSSSSSDSSNDNDGTCETVEEIIKSNPNLSHFSDLFDVATDAEVYYNGADTWTMFAPTDDAFDDSGIAIDTLSDYTAIRMLLFHEVKDEVLTSADLHCAVGENLIEMGSGQSTRTICFEDSPIGQKGGGNVDTANFVGVVDIKGCNGVVHIIDKVLLPPKTVEWYAELDLP